MLKGSACHGSSNVVWCQPLSVLTGTDIEADACFNLTFMCPAS